MLENVATAVQVDAPTWRPLHIAMIGQKGLPATYGGVEHHVEQLGRRLADRGHRVTVFNRSSYGQTPSSPYLGMEVRNAPTVASKHLDAFVHSASSTLLALASRCDIFHYHALGPGLFAPAPKALSHGAVLTTVHGLDHQRDKWGRSAKAVLGTGSWISGHVPDRTIVVSQALRQHYLDTFGRECAYIPNGVQAPQPTSAEPVRALGLQPGRYILFVGRLVREKAPDQLVRAYRDVPGDVPLVLAGDSPFDDDYLQQLRALAAADPRVRLTGYVFGDVLASLYQHAGLYAQPSLLEGLPLTILEAASHGLPIVASDIAPHRELLGQAGGAGRTLFPSGDLASLTGSLRGALDTMERDRLPAAAFGQEVLQKYNWDAATEALEAVYLDTLGARRGRRAARRLRGGQS